MSSFLEKLKKGMGVEAEQEEKSGAPKVQQQEEKQPRQKKPKTLEVKNLNSEQKTKKSEGEEKTDVKADVKKEKWLAPEGKLTVDVYETDGELVIQSAVAGVKPNDLDISIENDRVLIKGQRNQTSKEEGKNYFYKECYWGAFSREIILPVETDPGRAEAFMQQGILTIRLPKIEKEKKRKIEVKE